MPEEDSEDFVEELVEAARGTAYSVDAARAVKAMSDALDRIAGAEAVESLIDRVFEALSGHLDDDESLGPFVRDLIGSLREIQQVTTAIVGTAAVSLRAAERAAEGDDWHPAFSRLVTDWEKASAALLKQQDG